MTFKQGTSDIPVACPLLYILVGVRLRVAPLFLIPYAFLAAALGESLTSKPHWLSSLGLSW